MITTHDKDAVARKLEAEADQLRRTVPAFTRTVRAYDGDGFLEHVFPCTDEFAGSVLEMWSEQGCGVYATRGGGLTSGARFLVDVPDGRIFTLA